MTKNKIERPQMPWVFLWSSSSYRFFGYPPDLFERRLRRPLAAVHTHTTGRKRPASPEKRRTDQNVSNAHVDIIDRTFMLSTFRNEVEMLFGIFDFVPT